MKKYNILNVSKKNLKSLELMPKILDSALDCSHNELTSLKGRPEVTNGFFSCNNNKLTSLEYRPKMINGDFNCENNPDLTYIKKQIIKYQIEAINYYTDEGDFNFKSIKKRFEKYGLMLKEQEIKKEQEKQKKRKEIIEKNKRLINKTDYGISI